MKPVQTAAPLAATLATEVKEWENEGGAQAHAPKGARIDGITIVQTREYQVGSYRYTDFSLAVAERDRQRRRTRAD
ncbi:hypothetical protein DL238_00400 [Alteriqipengyuania lutimaris]|uniref:Uncharacterized protein n=1 Tax=Alteriqipengyuania lutimaris TaxID=1538146 RepID=A0A395LIV5_9SPHN|nr:hypothetical protein [Alteriqipengyuania lutimaris]RDS76227.1 hypothetical protein DL238_00400 [Alteriqipengyuania lutimaris]